MKSPCAKPLKVKVGNVSIPIYPNGDGRFAVVFREAGARIKRPYTTLAKAKLKAEEIAIRISNGQLEAGQFTSGDREIFLHVQRTVEPFGVSPAVAIEEWANSKRLAAAGPQRARIPLIVEQLIISKSDHKLSSRYMRDLTWLRDRFAKKFDSFIDEISQMQLENYLRELGVGDRRRNNIRDVIVTLFRFAKDHGYLPQDRDATAEKVKRIDLDHEAPRIYTPAQLRVLLEHVAPEWIDWICCQAFAGIRPEEAALPHASKKSGATRKLMWSDCMWDERQIRIAAQISKTRRDRYITVNDTFIAWCGHHRGETGPVCEYDRPDRETGRLGALLGFDWINDGLRHSYASYWNSLHKDMARLKEEMGNSESVNRRFYYHPQPAAIAKKWWTTLPDDQIDSAAGRRKVVQMPLAIGFGRVP